MAGSHGATRRPPADRQGTAGTAQTRRMETIRGAAPIATTGRTKTMIVPKAGETSAAKHGMAAATGRTAAGTGLGNETNGKWSASR